MVLRQMDTQSSHEHSLSSKIYAQDDDETSQACGATVAALVQSRVVQRNGQLDRVERGH